MAEEKTPEQIEEEKNAAAVADQKKIDEEQKADAAENAKEHPDDTISRGNETAERIEKANAVAAKQLEELRAIAVTKALGGESAAGTEPEKPKEETAIEYKNRVMKGEA